MSESPLMRKIRLVLASHGTRLFRNNVGQAWVGKVRGRGAETIVLEHPRPLHAGLCVGSSDLIGWHPVTITPDMVGRTVAVFCAVETKSADGRLRTEQRAFLQAVREAGGVAVVARCEQDAVEEVLRISQQ